MVAKSLEKGLSEVNAIRNKTPIETVFVIGGGKVYEAGVKISCIIEAEDFDFDVSEFGPDTRQEAQFHFQRDMLIDVNFRPDIGDIVSWNLGYFEITKTNFK